jgi:hypothetical protein
MLEQAIFCWCERRRALALVGTRGSCGVGCPRLALTAAWEIGRRVAQWTPQVQGSL